MPLNAEVERDVQKLKERSEAVQGRARTDGRLTIRQRAALLCEPGSLREVAPNAGVWNGDEFIPANFYLATGRLNRRRVVVGGEDFTISGGSPNLPGNRKSHYCEALALELRVPLVRLHEGAGGSVAGAKKTTEGPRPTSPSPPSGPPTATTAKTAAAGREKTAAPATAAATAATAATAAKASPLPSSSSSAPSPSQQSAGGGDPVFTPHRFKPIGRCLDTVPVASAILGAVVGLPAVRAAASHFVVMVKDALLLVAGPKVIEQALGDRGSKDKLGGPQVHLSTGVVDAAVATEAQAIELIQKFLSYLPTNVTQLPPRLLPHDSRDRTDPSLRHIIPEDRQQLFDVRTILVSVLDAGSFLELKRGMGQSLIIALGRLNGSVVGVVANDCRVKGGSITASACQKLLHLGELCQQFHIPIIHFVDVPGFMIGSEEEGTLTYGAKVGHFMATCEVPMATVHLRRAFGVAVYAHYGSVAPLVLAWPTSRTGALPVQAGVEIAFKRQLAAAADPEALRAKLEAEAESRLSVWPRVEAFGIHDLIDPAETRPRLCDWMESIEELLAELPRRSMEVLDRRSRF